MSSVGDLLIRGVEMPKNCEECDAKALCKNYWRRVREQYTRPSWCPLVPVPKHGRLIDADAYEALIRGLGNREYRREHGTICDAIKMLQPHYAPTIIPAEEGET